MNQSSIKIIEEYTITPHGTVQNPGRFEGEAAWVVAAYDDHLHGGWEDVGDFCYTPITTSDRVEFPANEAMQTGDYMTLEISDSGFVYGRIFSEAELRDILGEEFV